MLHRRRFWEHLRTFHQIQPLCRDPLDVCAWHTGAKLAPWAATPVLLAVRMGRYLSGPGCPPIPGLVPAYLALLEELNQDTEGDLAPDCISLA